MMAGEFLAVIGLCREVATFGKRVHDVARRVSTLFGREGESLGATLGMLNLRVENLGKLTEDDPRLGDDKNQKLKGLKDVLNEIKPELVKIEEFLEKLDKKREHSSPQHLFWVMKKYRSVKGKFDDYEWTLKELDKKVSDCVSDATLGVVLSATLSQEEIMKKQEETIKLLHQIIDVLFQLAEDTNDAMKYRTFLDKRGADLQVNPLELSGKKPLAESALFIYFTAMLEGRKVVIKQVRDVKNPEVIANFERETRNLWSFLRGSILQAYGIWNGEDEKFLVLEFMEKGSLAKVLREEELSLKQKFELAVTAANSLKRIHTKLVHTAVRTEKFLVDKDYTAKLSGLNYSKTFSSCRRVSVSSGMRNLPIYLYWPPEMYDQPIKPTTQQDIYGFGIVLWEIFTQTKPFSSAFGDDPTQEGVRKFLIEDEKEEYKLSMIQDPVKDGLSDLIRSCRSSQPKGRPSISFIVNTLEELSDNYEERMNMPE